MKKYIFEVTIEEQGTEFFGNISVNDSGLDELRQEIEHKLIVFGAEVKAKEFKND